MQLDLPTLFAVTTLVTAVMGALLVITGLQGQSVRALVWWGSGCLVGAVGAGLLSLRGIAADVLTINVANALVFAGYGIVWSGARRFGGRTVRPGLALSGATVWLVACKIPGFYGDIDLRVVLGSSIVSVYVLAAALELWYGRAEELRSRRIAVVLLGVHAAFYLVRIPLSFLYPLQGGQSLQIAWFAVLSFETILHTIAIGFIALGLAKERVELEQRIAATTDPLTGVLNRRGFLSRADAEIERAVEAGRPAALLLFDIDHFKRINDCWGHDAGDQALVAFSRVAAAQLGPGALFGRIGGEEFACLLTDVGEKSARRSAETVRGAISAAPVDVGGSPLRTTVSVGFATSAGSGYDVPALLAAADKALYRAKSLGRNRVEEARREETAERRRAA